MRDHARIHARIALSGALLLAALGSSAAVADGRCLTVELDRSVVLPDGSTHDAGSLSICADRSFSPTTTLHRVALDGRPAGLFLAKQAASRQAGGSDRPYVMFARVDDGTLALLGIGAVDGDRLTVREMNVHPKVESRWELAAVPSSAADPAVILLAAR